VYSLRPSNWHFSWQRMESWMLQIVWVCVWCVGSEVLECFAILFFGRPAHNHRACCIFPFPVLDFSWCFNINACASYVCTCVMYLCWKTGYAPFSAGIAMRGRVQLMSVSNPRLFICVPAVGLRWLSCGGEMDFRVLLAAATFWYVIDSYYKNVEMKYLK